MSVTYDILTRADGPKRKNQDMTHPELVEVTAVVLATVLEFLDRGTVMVDVNV
jgi:hypothetical protein